MSDSDFTHLLSELGGNKEVSSLMLSLNILPTLEVGMCQRTKSW